MRTNNVNPVVDVGDDPRANDLLMGVIRERSAARFVNVDFKGQPVQFAADGWINGTQVAARFGKRLDNWLRSPETKEYMTALADALKSLNSRDLIRRQRGRNGYTLLHPKLAVLFARYCDVRFAVWADMQIENILHGGIVRAGNHSYKRSSTAEREPLLAVVAAIVARHRLQFCTVYRSIDLYVGVAHARDMTCAQVVDATQFGQRLLIGTTKPGDWARIDANGIALGRTDPQLPLFEECEVEVAE